MDADQITAQVKKLLQQMINIDQDTQQQAITELYDPAATLTNPYMVLRGRDEIIKSYSALATNNIELSVKVNTVCMLK